MAIPNHERQYRIESNSNGLRRDMTIDNASLPFLMKTLTDLYANPLDAIAREYPINAWDSHRAANNPDPIEVTLPSLTNPTFVVQDHGVGMSVDDVLDNFSRYGWSSKRESDDYAGMMGLGCKAALTKVPMFTLTSVKDGVKVEADVYRGEKGVNGVEVTDTASTTEPNGVRVEIPIDEAEKFRNVATNFFRYWPKGAVLVNGEEPEHPSDGWWLDEDVFVERTYGDDILVMGNIAYPVKRRVTPSSHLRTIAWVDIGHADPTPSREHLADTERTNESLRALKEFVHERLVRLAQEEVDAAPSPSEALAVAHDWTGRLQVRHTFTYRGATLKSSLHLTKGWAYTLNANLASKIGRPNNDGYRPGLNIALPVGARYRFVTGHTTKTVTPTQRAKLSGYFDGVKNQRPSRVILVDQLPYALREWVDAIPWDEVERAAPVLLRPKSPTRQSKLLISPDGYYTVEADHERITSFKHLAYLTKDEFRSHKRRNALYALIQRDYGIVVVPARNIERFKKDHPRAVPVKRAIARELKHFTRRNRFMLAALLLHRRGDTYLAAARAIAALPATKIADPELRRFAKAIDDYGSVRSQWLNLGQGGNLPSLNESDTAMGEVLALIDRYPLLHHLDGAMRSSHGPDRVLTYVNEQHELHRLRQERDCEA